MIVPMDGGEPRVLDERTGPAHLEANQDGLSWTADGRHVLIAASDGETHRIMAYPVAGGDPTALIQVKESGQYPAIHPDGRRLVFQDGQVREELWVLDQLDEMP
jgi:Tol biopolymer transport system component